MHGHLDITKLLRDRICGIITSQIIGDLFGKQKNSCILKGKKKFRKPEGVQRCGDWERLDRDPQESRCFRIVELDKSVIVPEKENFSMNFANVATTSTKPPYWTCTVDNCGAPSADLAILRSLWTEGATISSMMRG